MKTIKLLKVLPILFISTLSFAEEHTLPTEPYSEELFLKLVASYKSQQTTYFKFITNLSLKAAEKSKQGITDDGDTKLIITFMCQAYRNSKDGHSLINRYPQYKNQVSAEAKSLETSYKDYHRMMKINYDNDFYRCQYYKPE